MYQCPRCKKYQLSSQGECHCKHYEVLFLEDLDGNEITEKDWKKTAYKQWAANPESAGDEAVVQWDQEMEYHLADNDCCEESTELLVRGDGIVARFRASGYWNPVYNLEELPMPEQPEKMEEDEK